jgi:hypothetical protein
MGGDYARNAGGGGIEMSEATVKLVIAICGIFFFANMGLLMANLKLYTEIMKEKSQRARRGTE